jgi:hypothetical protein
LPLKLAIPVSVKVTGKEFFGKSFGNFGYANGTLKYTCKGTREEGACSMSRTLWRFWVFIQWLSPQVEGT